MIEWIDGPSDCKHYFTFNTDRRLKGFCVKVIRNNLEIVTYQPKMLNRNWRWVTKFYKQKCSTRTGRNLKGRDSRKHAKVETIVIFFFYSTDVVYHEYTSKSLKLEICISLTSNGLLNCFYIYLATSPNRRQFRKYHYYRFSTSNHFHSLKLLLFFSKYRTHSVKKH